MHDYSLSPFSPTIRIAESAAAITNAMDFIEAFGQPEKRINCSAHVDANIRKQWTGVIKKPKRRKMN